MNLTFKVDYQYDIEELFEFLGENKEDQEEIAHSVEMDQKEVTRMVEELGVSDMDQVIEKLAEKKYERLLPFMKNSVQSFQESWDKIIEEFSSLVEEKTGHSWRHKDYYCVVSTFHRGISNWGGDTIVRKWSINADVQRKVTAHELTLSHFWTILEQDPTSTSWKDEKKWEYSEIFSWCLLGLEEDFQKFWPWLLKKDRWPLDHNYPEIVPLQEQLGELHSKCKDFKEFIEETIKKGTK